MTMQIFRGHHRKIEAAVQALEAKDLLPPYLRPVERDALILLELTRQGYGQQLPSPDAIRRYFTRVRETRQTREAV
jgi:hypothetical protein